MGSLLTEDVLVPLGAFAMVVLLVWFGIKIKKTRIQEQAELRKRLLDKFSSSQELTQFLASPQGQNFLKDQEAGQRSPRGRIVSSIVSGVVLVMLGAAFFILYRLQQGFVYPGVILTALGVGLLVGAAISYYLYKRWNMIE